MKYFILLVLLNSCSYNYGQSPLPKDHYVVLPFDKDAYPALAKNSSPASLIKSDFVIIDQVLSVCIDKYNKEQTVEYNKMIKKSPQNEFQLTDFIIDLKKYYRQYMVTKNKKGEKEVWVNCFCNIQNMDYWKKQVVFVKDGGNCFFNVKINLTKKSFSDFEVNGEA